MRRDPRRARVARARRRTAGSRVPLAAPAPITEPAAVEPRPRDEVDALAQEAIECGEYARAETLYRERLARLEGVPGHEISSEYGLARLLPPAREIELTTDPDRILELAPLSGSDSQRPSVRAARGGAPREQVVTALAAEIDAWQQADAARVARYERAARPFLAAFRGAALAALPLAELTAAGDGDGARRRLEEALAIRSRLAAADPTNAVRQRELGIGLTELGDSLLAAGDLAGARARFAEGLEIHRRLAASSPASATAQRDLAVALTRLAGLLEAGGESAAALARFEESLEIDRRLAAADPARAEAQRDLAVSLSRIGGLLATAGDLARAQARLEESLAIVARLAAANPASAEAQQDLAASLGRIGDVLSMAGDEAGARARYERSLEIARELAAASSASGARRDLIFAHARLGTLPGGDEHWRAALAVALELEREGLLEPSDAPLLDFLRRSAAAAAPGPP